MSGRAMTGSHSTWFLSAPDSVSQARRGDPLGLRNLNNEAADLLAPGLTNRTIDARWMSILSWALVHSDRAWKKAGGADLRTADERAKRYDWLRPLELLWVKRSVHIGGEGYQALQWPGYRSLRRWDEARADFGMTERQRKNHRQLGAYGAYRVLLRTARFTRDGDGWTPDEHAKRLAKHVDEQLERDGALPRIGRTADVDPASWWLQKGWHSWRAGASKNPILLSPSTPIKKLAAAERNVLADALFNDEARLRCAEIVGASKARDYIALCEELAKAVPNKGGDARLRSLGRLAALSSAGVDLLRATADAVAAGEDKLVRLARHDNVVQALDAFVVASNGWTSARHTKRFESADEADRLASLAKARGRSALLNQFVDHHVDHASGVPWFARTDDTLLLDGARSGVTAGGFGYRLHALSNLAYQCGVSDSVPPALSEIAAELDKEEVA